MPRLGEQRRVLLGLAAIAQQNAAHPPGAAGGAAPRRPVQVRRGRPGRACRAGSASRRGARTRRAARAPRALAGVRRCPRRTGPSAASRTGRRRDRRPRARAALFAARFQRRMTRCSSTSSSPSSIRSQIDRRSASRDRRGRSPVFRLAHVLRDLGREPDGPDQAVGVELVHEHEVAGARRHRRRDHRLVVCGRRGRRPARVRSGRPASARGAPPRARRAWRSPGRHRPPRARAAVAGVPGRRRPSQPPASASGSTASTSAAKARSARPSGRRGRRRSAPSRRSSSSIRCAARSAPAPVPSLHLPRGDRMRSPYLDSCSTGPEM